MELPVSLQAAQYGAAAALGILLGLFYDFLRLLRRRHPKLTVSADLLFSIVLLQSLLALTLYVGRGELRIFMLLGVLLGTAVYFLTVSRLVLRVTEVTLRLLLLPLRKARDVLHRAWQKSGETRRKTVAIIKKTVKIETEKRKKTPRRPHRQRGKTNAVQKNTAPGKAAHSGTLHFRPRHTCQSAKADTHTA